MKLDELTRLKLENIQLKRNLLLSTFEKMQAESEALANEWNTVVKKFCEEHNLDANKINIQVQTGEIILPEGGNDA